MERPDGWWMRLYRPPELPPEFREENRDLNTPRTEEPDPEESMFWRWPF